MAGLVQRVRRRMARRRPRVPDPFATLELQRRLTRLSAELDQLERGVVPAFAVGHHARAAMIAYDATLAEACRLIGSELTDADGPLVLASSVERSSRRVVMEATLVNAGWTW